MAPISKKCCPLMPALIMPGIEKKDIMEPIISPVLTSAYKRFPCRRLKNLSAKLLNINAVSTKLGGTNENIRNVRTYLNCDLGGEINDTK